MDKLFALFGAITAVYAIKELFNSFKNNTKMTKPVLILILAFIFIGVSVFINFNNRQDEKKLEVMQTIFNTEHVTVLDNDYGKVMRIEFTTTDSEDIYKRCKTAFPLTLKYDVISLFPDVERGVLLSNVINFDTGETIEKQVLNFSFKTLGEYDFDKIKNYDDLLETSNLLP